MSKRSRQVTSAPPRSKSPKGDSSEAITSTPRGPRVNAPESNGRGRWRWLILGAVALVLLVGWSWYLVGEWQSEPSGNQSKRQAKDTKKKPRTPTEADKLIARFIDLRKSGGDASALLADLPADDVPISEEEFERRAAGHFLRDPGLQVLDFAPGEVDSNGRERSSDRHTLITKGNTRTPHFQVLERNGKVSSTALSMFNPDIVVEVRNGKIHPIRTEAHRDR